jgi:ribosomal protein S18 acetylase RimI-like enzyme
VNASQSAAVGLYRRFGFEVVREVNAVLGDGKTHREYVMERSLP